MAFFHGDTTGAFNGADFFPGCVGGYVDKGSQNPSINEKFRQKIMGAIADPLSQSSISSKIIRKQKSTLKGGTFPPWMKPTSSFNGL